ncbi:UDP-glucose 4-epimerase [Bacillus sp. JCM 19047]|nr:UDP-glucose 4-epimerase [Bacillus sp. JCM 19047]
MTKRILITGKSSYIGNSFIKYIEKKYTNEYVIDKLTLRTDEWKYIDFSVYCTVLHLAGIVHQKINKGDNNVYYSINRDLSYNLALKAKNEGVNQFIFLSTMSVYGLESGEIKIDTPKKPINDYGKSKLEAEKLIVKLGSDDFKVAIVRPPMVYGKNCSGNYARISKLTGRLILFPNINNYRSMIFIDHLSEFLNKVIEKNNSGYYHPQNDEYVKTKDMVKLIGLTKGKKIKFTCFFNPFIRTMKLSVFKKLFGTLVYAKDIDGENKMIDYNLYDFKRSIDLSER